MNSCLTISRAVAAAALAALCAKAGANPPAPGASDRAIMTAVMAHFLADHGDFCLGKMDWPVDISALDERARGRDALQMPVLESLGLVRSRMTTALRVEGRDVEEDAAPVPVAVRRYELTPAGEAAMRSREIVVAGPDGDRTVRRRDLCAARLDLASLVDLKAWTVPAGDIDHVVATFTYGVTAAPWAGTSEFRRVFPMAARVIDGAHDMQLKQSFKRVAGGWVPEELAE